MNVFFDIDNTIIGTVDASLRPGTHEVFAQLVEHGHDVYIWSGMGVRWPEVRKHGLDQYVKDVCQKPMSHYEDGLVYYRVPVRPDFIIDDHPEIVDHFGGHCIAVYLNRGPGFYGDADTELMVVPGLIEAHAAVMSSAATATAQ